MGKNVLGVCAAAALATSIGGITGDWWWSLFVVGLVLALMSWAAHRWEFAELDEAEASPAGGDGNVEQLDERRAKRGAEA